MIANGRVLTQIFPKPNPNKFRHINLVIKGRNTEKCIGTVHSFHAKINTAIQEEWNSYYQHWTEVSGQLSAATQPNCTAGIGGNNTRCAGRSGRSSLLVLACVSLAVQEGVLGPPTGLESLLHVMTRQVFGN